MSVYIFKLKNRMSAESLLVLWSKTGSMRVIIGSYIESEIFWLVPSDSTMRSKAFKNSSAPVKEYISWVLSSKVAMLLINAYETMRFLMLWACRMSRMVAIWIRPPEFWSYSNSPLLLSWIFRSNSLKICPCATLPCIIKLFKSTEIAWKIWGKRSTMPSTRQSKQH